MNHQLAIAELDAKAGEVGFAHAQLKNQYPELGFIFDQLEDALADKDEVEQDLERSYQDDLEDKDREIENLKDVLQQIRNVADAALPDPDDERPYGSSDAAGQAGKFAVALDIIAGKADEAID